MTPGDLSRRSFMELVGATGVAAGSGEAANAVPTADMGSADDQDSSIPIENQLIMAYESGTDLAAVQAAAMRVVLEKGQQAHFGHTDEDLGCLVIGLVDPITTDKRDEIKDEIANKEPIIDVAVNHVVTVDGAPPNQPYIPKDPKYGEQKNAQHINAEEAWKYTKGSNQEITIVDTKAKVDHEDFENVFKDPPGTMAVRKLFQYVDSSPQGWDSQSPTDHGTQMSGIAGAKHNNDKGVAGISQADLFNVAVPLKRIPEGIISYDVGQFYTSVRFAIMKTEARIINVSAGTSSADPPEICNEIFWDQIVDAAVKNENLIVNSAGSYSNEVPDEQKLVSWEVIKDNVLGVGSTHKADEVAPDSARGPEVDVYAPGYDVTTTSVNEPYGKSGGSSAAAPVVSGVAAMCWETHPQLMLDDMIQRMKKATTGNYEGGAGKIDALLAIFMPPGNVESVFNDALTQGYAEQGQRIIQQTQIAQNNNPAIDLDFLTYEIYSDIVDKEDNNNP